MCLRVHDILNQTRNLTHTVTDNYVEDSYRLEYGVVVYRLVRRVGSASRGLSGQACLG